MTGPIDRARPVGDRRQQSRRAEDRAEMQDPPGGTNLPVPVEPVVEAAGPHGPDPDGAFAAHLYGQTGQRRGLRGGQPVLDAARSAYLETEFSGPSDRRPPKGLLKKTEI